MERHFIKKVQTHHHHPGHPEENNVKAGNQNISRVVARNLRRLFRPAKRRKRPKCRRKPGVQHIFIAGNFRRLTIVFIGGGLRFFFCQLDKDFTIRAEPSGNLMAPPDLAGNAPRLDIAHPLEIGVLPVFGDKFGTPLFNRFDRRLR